MRRIYGYSTTNIISRTVLLALLLVSFQLKAARSQIVNYSEAKIHYCGHEGCLPDFEQFSDFDPFPESEHAGQKQGEYWVTFELEQAEESPGDLVLEIPTHNINHVELFVVQGGELVSLGKSGNKEALDPSRMYSRFPAFWFNPPDDGDARFYLNVHFHKEANLPVRMYSAHDYFELLFQRNWMSGLFYGILIMVLIVNLFFFFKFKNPVFLYYSFFLSAYSLIVAIYDGVFINFQRDWPFEGTGESLILVLMEVSIIVFSYRFLRLDDHLPKAGRIVYPLAAIMLSSLLVYIITGNYAFYGISNFTGMLTFLSFWIMSMYLYKKLPYAKYYALGYGILIGAGFYVVLGYNFGVFALTADNLTLKIASVADMLIFTYAITYRMKVRDDEYREIRNQIESYLVQREEDQKQLLREELKKPLEAQNNQNGDPFLQLLKENELSVQPLTSREVDIAKCIRKGLSNHEIAEELHISYNTVKYHTKNIYQKLEIKTRNEAQEKLQSLSEVQN